MKGDKIALFDMDGTLCAYMRQLNRDLAEIASPEDPPFKSFDDIEPFMSKRIDLIRSVPGWWQNLPKLEIGYDVLLAASEMGFDIHILTKGPWLITAAWTEKVIWCRQNIPHEIDFHTTITEDKSLVYGRVLVDDYPQYIESWLASRPRGLVIMPAHDYNEDFKHPNVCRYDGTNKSEMKDRLYEAYCR